MFKEDITREMVEKKLLEINPSEIPSKNLSKSGTNQLAYYLLYNGEYYPPKYIINQCGVKEINSIQANSILKKLDFEICDSNSNEQVLKIILKNFYKRAYEGVNQKTSDITRNVVYKNFNVHISFGKGSFSKNPFVVFLKDGNKSQNGVYPYTNFDRESNTINIGIGTSNKEIPELIHKISKQKNDSIENTSSNIREFEVYKTNIFVKESLTDSHLEEIVQRINYYINKYNEIFSFNEQNEGKKNEEKNMNNIPLNQIFFGPPGTGKTYNVLNKAVEIINRDIDINNRPKITQSFNKHKENGQIVFTTFHQSYGYEEFIEGLRSNECGSFAPANGIFKDLCDRARNDKFESLYEYLNRENVKAYKLSLGYSTNEVLDYCFENNVIALGMHKKIDFTNCNTIEEIEKNVSYNLKLGTNYINCFKNEIKIGDLIFATNKDKDNEYRAIGKVSGEYFYKNGNESEYTHFRKIEWLFTNTKLFDKNMDLMEKNESNITFYNIDLNYLSEIKPFLLENKIEVEKNFVMIIDEINRGNMSKIFGELITLIEDDKREKAKNELSVVLPYSKEIFSIPSNVYIIGTMNTADRSIALLDTALRRRFTFVEMMPQTDLLQEKVINGIELSEFLSKINDRIEYLFDREHSIGHAYFINCNTFEELQLVMTNKVIPLLQEYFYDEWEKIELVLGGCGNESTKEDYFIYKKELNKDIFNKNPNLSDFIEENKSKYFITQNPSEIAFSNLIGTINEEN